MISDRLKKIKSSATLDTSTKAKEMKKQGQDVVIFGAGQPDFATPSNIKNAAIKAINDNFTGYTAASGIPELKKAIANKFKRDNNIDYTPKEIIVGCGGKHILYNIMQSFLNKDDEVILPKPYWVSYEEQTKLADGKIIFTETDKTFKIKANLINEKITDKTKLIILNSPSNPAGAICDENEIKKIADLAINNNIYVISDEVYESFIYDSNKHFSIASFNDEIKNLTLTVNAVSKTYSMTGWRIGYCGGPEDIIKAMDNLQSHSTSNPTSISQMAALEALNGQQDSIRKMVDEFDKRRKFMFKRLNEIVNISCVRPEGAFYCFPDISKTGLKSFEFADKLLEKEKVAVVPGIAFGSDTHIRLSYAASMEDIEKGLDRLDNFVKKLK